VSPLPKPLQPRLAPSEVRRPDSRSVLVLAGLWLTCGQPPGKTLLQHGGRQLNGGPLGSGKRSESVTVRSTYG